MGTKRYISDGVYADVENGAIVLTTEDGVSVTNRIVLDPITLDQLCVYIQELEKTVIGLGRWTRPQGG